MRLACDCSRLDTDQVAIAGKVAHFLMMPFERAKGLCPAVEERCVVNTAKGVLICDQMGRAATAESLKAFPRFQRAFT